jgi:hypothetical protein
MKKIFTIILLWCVTAHAQTNICVSVDCKDSVRMNSTDSISLNGVITASSATTQLWRVVAGSAILTAPTNKKAYAHGLSIGMNIFQLTAQTSSSTATANDTVVAYAPCPVCPVCKVYTHADTLAIQALKICPTCPVCPPPIKQRTAVGVSWDLILNKKTITYDDGTVTVL